MIELATLNGTDVPRTHELNTNLKRHKYTNSSIIVVVAMVTNVQISDNS